MDIWVKYRLWITSILFCFTFIFIVFSTFHQCRELALGQAENNLSTFLLNHKATRDYVEYVQKPEIYRLKKTNRLYEEYFSPKLLSGTFISRNINELQNKNRSTAGLEEIYFKFASPNPRNPVNKADSAELELLATFNSGTLKEYKELVHIGDDTFLYYALPIDRNMAICLRCHGDPANAPQEMIDLYGDTAGFHEKLGEMRALMSVRVPVNWLLAKADRTASMLSVITFFLLSGAFAVVHLLFREADKQKKIALNNSYYLNSVLQSSIDTAILATDACYTIEYCNNTAENIFQLPVVEMLNHNFLDIAERIGLPASGHAEKVVDIVKQQGSFRFCFEFEGKTIEAQVSKIGGPGNDNAGFLLMGQDITERISKEKEREEIKNRLARAERMESIALLAGGIAHDFNNILSVILGYAEITQEDCPAGSSIKKNITQVLKATHRAKDLVQQILAFSRQSEMARKPIQPEVMAREAIKMLRSTLPTTIDIRQEIDQHLLPILADPTQFHQILMNLCTNAFHAMEATGGTLTVVLKNTTLSPQDLPTGEKGIQAGDFVQISVHDTGAGIPPDILGRIFEPYFTTKEVGKGTGIGLSIIHGIVKAYGGFATCHSTLGQGTRFEVYLPALENIEKAEAEAAPSPQLGSERLLLVDDEELLVEMSQHMLERLGYQVTVRMNSIEALKTFQNHPDAFDLVLTDQTMPGITGFDLALRMLHIRPNLPIILCTGYSSQVSEEKAKANGIKGFALKPLAKNDIAALIRRLLDESKSGDPGKI